MTRPTRDSVISLVSQLVAIDSINPSLVPGAPGEESIARFVAGWLHERGLVVEMQEVAPGRPNVVGRLHRGQARTLILNAHVDTVGTVGMDRPHEPHVEGDRLYGRGAYDMKGGLAAMMLAAEIVARVNRPGGDLIVTAVADEEYASLGTEAIVRQVHADAAIVTEPTALRLCTAHKGFAWIAVETRGRAAHGSKPDLGIDAIAHMGRVLVALETLSGKLATAPGHPLLGTGSLHASLIEGGQELSSYPESCRLKIERRTIPGDSPAAVLDEIQTILARLSHDHGDFSGNAELSFWRDPFEVSSGETIVTAVAGAVEATLGTQATIYGDTPWMDAALLSAGGIPTVVFGPGGAGAHAVTEYVSIDDVATCAHILADTVLDFCGSE